jgi:8-oxo-dGTP pyrophosphatase MutT (NUDIX family)
MHAMASLRDLLGCEPHEVPSRAPDGPLTAVKAERLTPPGLREVFQRPPQWQPELKRERRWGDAQTTRAAAVLVPIVMRAQPTVLLTQRTAHLPTHAGQIAFPGGKIDPHDHDAAAAALREAHEEVHLAPHWVEVLGAMPSYYTGSGFDITPVVGLVNADAPWRPNPSEVEQVFEVPLHFLMDARHHRVHEAEMSGQTVRWWSMPYATAEQSHYIWGATAAMLRNFYCLLRAAD